MQTYLTLHVLLLYKLTGYVDVTQIVAREEQLDFSVFSTAAAAGRRAFSCHIPKTGSGRTISKG
jgi:hypothetical protein